jgi:plasmid stabilization system protein ParE
MPHSPCKQFGGLTRRPPTWWKSSITSSNATAAQNLYDTIVQSAESLSLMPYLFRPARVAGTREQVVHPNYIVLYLVGTDVIDILRVLHSRQEYP